MFDFSIDTTNIDAEMNGKYGWILRESGLNLFKRKKYESVLAQGNGHIGVRACLEEPYADQARGLFVAGTYNKCAPEEMTELPNCADITEHRLVLDGENFSLINGEILEYERFLNLRNGELIRRILWKSPQGRRYRLVFKRFVSLANLHVIAFKIMIEPLDGDSSIVLKTGIDGRMTNSGAQHFLEGIRRLEKNREMQLLQVTTETGTGILFSCALKKENVDASFGLERRSIFGTYPMTAEAGSRCTFEKIATVYSTTDWDANNADNSTDAFFKRGLDSLESALSKGYDALFEESCREWEKYWTNCEIEINGCSLFELTSLRAAQYHLRIMTPCHDSRLSIAAKGLTGEGYKGHVFWDTEMFILPYFLFSEPAAAKSLLMFRYHTLHGARKKAAANGYDGAMFAWESARTGDEETPEWALMDIRTGRPTRVWSGAKEHHVVADIAYATWYYWRATGDWEFMESYGFEIILECAWFWCSRVNYREGKGYVILDIIGPDEYTEHIDNNAYTNYLAAKVLEYALNSIELLKARDAYGNLNGALKLDERICRYRQVLDGLYLPKPNAHGILPQDDTFLGKKIIDIARFREQPGKQSIMKEYSRDQVVDMQVLKQADVVMLLAVVPELFNNEICIKNLDYYEEKTIHDSSLSASVHGLLYAKTGRLELSRSFFEKTCKIDFGPDPYGSEDGIHAASMAGIWLDVIQGFGGISVLGDELHIHPRLPESWHRIRFPLKWRGSGIKVEITHQSVEAWLVQGEPVEIFVKGQLRVLQPKKE